jgi:mRNA-degrading endonuclease toxin of MazEF toxin-antitoxin module
VPIRDGEARKIVLIISRNTLNKVGMNVILARLTSQQRYRDLPTTVEVHPSDENGLATTSFVLCHDVVTRPQTVLDPRRKGSWSWERSFSSATRCATPSTSS